VRLYKCSSKFKREDRSVVNVVQEKEYGDTSVKKREKKAIPVVHRDEVEDVGDDSVLVVRTRSRVNESFQRGGTYHFVGRMKGGERKKQERSESTSRSHDSHQQNDRFSQTVSSLARGSDTTVASSRVNERETRREEREKRIQRLFEERMAGVVLLHSLRDVSP